MEVVESKAEATEQPKEIYDVQNEKWVPNPLLNKEKKDSEEETEVLDAKKPAKEEKKTTKEKEKEAEKEESEEEEPEEEGNEEESEEEEEVEDTKKESPEAKKKDDTLMDPDQFFAHTYGERYGIKTQAELDNVIENSLDLMGEHEALQEKYKKLEEESKKPKFASDKQQKAYEFLSQYDLDRQGEALDTFAKLLSMDPDNTDGVILLEEQFVHQHPEWTRNEAQKMFKKEYNRKYLLDRNKFEGTDEEFKQEQEDLKIMEKGEVARAKSYLKEQKAKYKPAEKEVAKTNEVVTKAIEKTAESYHDHFDKVKEIPFEHDGEKYIFDLDADKKEQVSSAIDAWVKNPANYNEKGELKGIKNPGEVVDMLVGSLFLKDIVTSMIGQIKNQTNTKRVDEIAVKHPKKRALNPGDSRVNRDNLDEEGMRLIRERSKKAA